jgi:hypothetical protein
MYFLKTFLGDRILKLKYSFDVYLNFTVLFCIDCMDFGLFKIDFSMGGIFIFQSAALRRI